MTLLVMKRYWRQFVPIVCVVVGLLLPGQLNAAEKSTTKSSTKAAKASTTKKKTSVTKHKQKIRPPVSPPVEIDEATAHSRFDTFTQEWMVKLAQAEEYHRTRQVKVSQDADGFFAEYVGYLPQRYIKVKKTTSQETPYVGTLTYYERVLRCRGKTKEDALKGPFEQDRLVPVREIFRFTRGEWVY